MNDNEMDMELMVYIVIGCVWEIEGVYLDEVIMIYVLLIVFDDDDVVCKILEFFFVQGFLEVEFDQIGVMDGELDDFFYEGVYQDVFLGNVVIVIFIE